MTPPPLWRLCRYKKRVVIPAKAEIQGLYDEESIWLDARLCGHDGLWLSCGRGME